MREPRKKPKEHKDLDSMKPFSYLDLGSENDPCFGKEYSPNAKECKKCGDCEACAIVYSQKGFLKQIKAQNKKSEFLDIQEGELRDKQDKQILKLMEARVKKNKTKSFSIAKIATKMVEKFNLIEADLEYVKQRCIKMAEDSSIIQLDTKLKKYQYGKDN